MLKVIVFALLALAVAEAADYCRSQEVGLRFGVRNSCSKFTICSATRRLLTRECPRGLYFNERKQVCDYPSRVSCQKEPFSKRRIALQCEGCDKACCEPVDIPDDCDCDGTPNGGTKPYPDDCYKYQVCTNGAWVTASCGSGLNYNSNTGQCDNTYNPLCDDGCNTGNGNCGDTPNGGTKPYPSDCYKYQVCSNGAWTIVSCASGLNYNSATGKCDDAHNPLCEDCNTGGGDCGDTPNGGTKPYPNDCYKYQVCSNGAWTIVSCGSGLNYNSATGKCDSSYNALCPGTPGPNTGPSGVSCLSGGLCVGVADGTGFAFPSAKCTSKYIICQCECEMERSCSDDLVYNEKLGVCDWPYNVGCA